MNYFFAMATINNKKLLQESFKDIEEDFEELLYLYVSSLQNIQLFIEQLEKNKSYVPKGTYQTVHTQAKVYAKDFIGGISYLRIVKNTIKKEKLSVTTIKELSDIHEKYFNLFRSQQGLIGALITSTDWQSPSFYHSKYSMAGR